MPTASSVCRVIKNSNYTTMSNYHLRSKNLSLKAIGLLSKVFSLPDDWDYSISGLVAACIANSLMAEKKSIRWFQSTQLVELNSFLDEEDYYRYLSNISNPDLIIIDDLGAEHGSDYALERVYSIIEYRISTGKPMIITTNLELEEIKSATDIRKIRTYDRLFRVCFPIPFHGVSFRKKHARDNFETMNELLNA